MLLPAERPKTGRAGLGMEVASNHVARKRDVERDRASVCDDAPEKRAGELLSVGADELDRPVLPAPYEPQRIVDVVALACVLAPIADVCCGEDHVVGGAASRDRDAEHVPPDGIPDDDRSEGMSRSRVVAESLDESGSAARRPQRDDRQGPRGPGGYPQ